MKQLLYDLNWSQSIYLLKHHITRSHGSVGML